MLSASWSQVKQKEMLMKNSLSTIALAVASAGGLHVSVEEL
jgi:hypothetical protein